MTCDRTRGFRGDNMENLKTPKAILIALALIAAAIIFQPALSQWLVTSADAQLQSSQSSPRSLTCPQSRQYPTPSPVTALPAFTKIPNRSLLSAACMMRRNDCSAGNSYSLKTAYNLTARVTRCHVRFFCATEEVPNLCNQSLRSA